jgi:hypothetical protein
VFSSGRIEAHGDVRALLGRQPVQARQAIRKILVGKLTFVPMRLDGYGRLPLHRRSDVQPSLGR